MENILRRKRLEMTLKTGNYHTIWNKKPRRGLKQIHDYIKYQKFEPLSAERLVNELLAFGEQIAMAPYSFPLLKKLSNERFDYYSVSYKKFYRFIFRINEKNKQVIIVNLFHNKRSPKMLRN